MKLRHWLGTATTAALIASTVSSPVFGSAHFTTQQNGAVSNSVAANAVVALGDSITFGYNLGDNKKPSTYAFPFLIAKQTHLQTIDLGQPGWTSAQLYQALQAGTDTEALQSAALVTLYVGGNDLLQPAYSQLKNTPIDQLLGSKPVSLNPAVKQQLDENLKNFNLTLPKIVADIRAVTQAPIVLYNLYNPVANAISLHSLADTYIVAANHTVSQVASQTHCVLVNAYGAFENHQLQYMLPMDVHPNVQGQAVLAKIALQALSDTHTTVTSSVYGPPTGGSSGTVTIPPSGYPSGAQFLKFVGWLGLSYRLPVILHNGQVYLSLSALMNAMNHNGFKDTWNGKQWNIQFSTAVAFNIGHIKLTPVGKGSAQIILAGVPVVKFNPLVVKVSKTGQPTTYLPLSLLTSLFKQVGLGVTVKDRTIRVQL